MIDIIQGTTPVIECNSDDIDFSKIANIWVSFTSGDHCIHFSLANGDVDTSDDMIRVSLSQEQTLSMNRWYYLLTIRVLYENGTAVVSEDYARISPIGRGGVIDADN